jgi:Tol biopolymer transport system component
MPLAFGPEPGGHQMAVGRGQVGRRWAGVVAAALVGSLALGGSAPAAAESGGTERVSISLTGQQATGQPATLYDLTPDGRYVVFSSRAPELNDGVTPAFTSLFVRDRVAGTTTRVSPGQNTVLAAAISDDGRWVIARFSGGLLGGTVLVDRTAGTTTVLTLGANTPATADRAPTIAITGDGSRVAFTNNDGIARTRVTATGTVTDRGAGWVRGISDDGQLLLLDLTTTIVRRDLSTGVDTDVTGAPGQTVDGTSFSLSADGSVVAFTSSSAPVSVDGRSQVLVWDEGVRRRLATGTEVTVGALGTAVAYLQAGSEATDPVRLLVHDLISGRREPAAVRLDNADPASSPAQAGRLSADGRHVGFASTDAGLVPDDTNAVADVFVRDRLGDLGAGEGALHGTVVTADGPVEGALVIATSSFGTLATTTGPDGTFALADVPSGVWRTFTLVDDHLGTWHPSTQHEGRSTPLGLDPGEDLDASITPIEVDLGPARVVSRTAATPGDGSSGDGAISADGRHVLFASSSTTLVPDDPDDTADLLVADRQTAMLERVDVTVGDGWPAAAAIWSDLSADGRLVAFASAADLLVAGDTDGQADLFVRDLDTDTTTRVTGEVASIRYRPSAEAALAPDGSEVVYRSGTTTVRVPTDGGPAEVLPATTAVVEALADGGGTRLSTTVVNAYSKDVAVSGANAFSCTSCTPSASPTAAGTWRSAATARTSTCATSRPAPRRPTGWSPTSPPPRACRGRPRASSSAPSGSPTTGSAWPSRPPGTTPSPSTTSTSPAPSRSTTCSCSIGGPGGSGGCRSRTGPGPTPRRRCGSTTCRPTARRS